MEKEQWAIVATFGLSALGVLGDSLLKTASGRQHVVWNRWFLAGLIVFALTAFGWVFVMRHLKLATIGALYSLSMILLLTLVGAIWFKERLTYSELAGVVLAAAAVALLSRMGH